jgi:simple sugar transport system substrate-binding protein
MSTRKFWRGAAVGALALALAAACSSQGGAQNQPGASSGGSGGGAVTGGKNYTIAMITHEQAGDTFWDKIRAST